MIPPSVFIASSLRRNPLIGSATIELQYLPQFSSKNILQAIGEQDDIFIVC
jgi:hypothetical protein